MNTIERPNILLVYTDQQRFDSLGCYGNTKAHTPNLDRLAQNGIRLEQYYVQNPVCMPSRMSFLTGQYPARLGIGCNGIPLPEDTPTIASLLKPYGYHTANIGKLHFQPHAQRDYRDPHPPYGFDTLILSDEPGCYNDAYTKWVQMIDPQELPGVRTALPPAAEFYGKPSYSRTPRETHEPYTFKSREELTHSSFVASETCRFIREHTAQRFFCIAGFYAPHTPIDPPQRFIDLYADVEFSPPVLGKDEKMEDRLKNLNGDQWQEIIRHYMALVSHVDDCVGQILQELEVQNLLESTMIIFTTDHGEFLGDHGRIQKGMPGHDCITRVPCILSLPGQLQRGAAYNQLIEAVDIIPTILDYCGIQKPAVMQGKSLRSILEEPDRSHRDSIFIDYFTPLPYHEEKSIDRQSTIRTTRYKYFVTDGEEILYDISNDPQELTNVASDPAYAEDLTELRKTLISRLQNSGFVNPNRITQY